MAPISTLGRPRGPPVIDLVLRHAFRQIFNDFGAPCWLPLGSDFGVFVRYFFGNALGATSGRHRPDFLPHVASILIRFGESFGIEGRNGKIWNFCQNIHQRATLAPDTSDVGTKTFLGPQQTLETDKNNEVKMFAWNININIFFTHSYSFQLRNWFSMLRRVLSTIEWY